MFINRQKRKLPIKPAWSGISECRFSSDAKRNSHFSGRSLGAYLPQLTRKAFEKFGFSTASLILEWSTIVGDELALRTTPEEVKWPKTADLAPASSHSRPSAALLVLRVDPAHILETSYSVSQIKDRINRYFGYRAITDIRLLSAPLNTKGTSNRTHSHRAFLEKNTENNSSSLEDPLNRALAKLKDRLQTASVATLN